MQQRVFGEVGRYVPPFSTSDWSALALAELISDRKGRRCQLIENEASWTAVWFEPRAGEASRLP